MKIVLISGKQGSGKSTLANGIQAYWLGRAMGVCEHFCFAEPLYDMHNLCLNYLRKEAGIDRGNKDGVLLQLLGTEWGRKTVDENIWVNIMKHRIRTLESENRHNPLVVVSDCRFQNELDAFPQALKVRLECDRDIRKGRAHSWRDSENHQSETDLDGAAFHLTFNSGVQPLELYLRLVIDRILAK